MVVKRRRIEKLGRVVRERKIGRGGERSGAVIRKIGKRERRNLAEIIGTTRRTYAYAQSHRYARLRTRLQIEAEANVIHTRTQAHAHTRTRARACARVCMPLYSR